MLTIRQPDLDKRCENKMPEIYSGKVLVGTERDGEITPADTEQGRQLQNWLDNGVPGLNSVTDGDEIIEKDGIIPVDHPLFGLALLEHFEHIGWLVKEDLKGEKHLRGRHDQRTHAHGSGVIGELSGVDCYKWKPHSMTNYTQKKISKMEKAFEEGDIDTISKVKVKGASNMEELLTKKNVNVFDKTIMQAKENLLAKHQNGCQKPVPPKGLKFEEAVATSASGEKVVYKDVVNAVGWVQTGPQLGTQLGGRFKGDDGKEYYVKLPKDDAAAINEVCANKLFKAAGANVPKAYLITVKGKIGIATEWQEGTQKADYESSATKNLVSKDFATHAWLANWDCIGAGSENPEDNIRISVEGGIHKAVAVDVGGSMFFKGTGVEKDPKAFSNDVNEWDTLRDPSINPTAAKVFGGMTEQQLIDSAGKVSSVADQTIEAICNKYCPPGHDPGDLASKMISRKEDILAKAEALSAGKHVDLKKTTPTTATNPDGNQVTPKSIGPSIAPPPTLANNVYYQTKLNKMHKLAKQGKWDEIEAVDVPKNPNSTNGKLVKSYKDQLLASKVHGGSVTGKTPPDPKNPIKINPSLFPDKPVFLSTNAVHLKQNNDQIDQLYKLGEKGDVDALKSFPNSPSPKVNDYRDQLIANLGTQLNPPPPPVNYTGKFNECVAKLKPVVGKKVQNVIGDYMVLGSLEPVPDVKIPSGSNKANGKPAQWDEGYKAYQEAEARGYGHAMRAYTSFSYTVMNGELRGHLKLSSETMKAAKGYTEHSIPLPEGMVLSRGLHLGSSEAEVLLKAKPGTVIQDRGIISTKYSGKWKGNVQWKMVVGPGVRGLPVEKFTVTKGENEIVLPPNTRFMIRSTKKKPGDKLEVEAVILPFHEGQCCPP